MVPFAGALLLRQGLTLRLYGSLPQTVALPLLFAFHFTFLLYLRFLWNVTIVLPVLAAAFWLTASLDSPRPRTLPALAARFTTAHENHPVAEVLDTVESLGREILPGSRGFHRALLAGSLLAVGLAATRRDAASRAFRFQLLVLSGSWVTFLFRLRAIPESMETYYLRRSGS